MNNVILSGRLVRDIELKYTSNQLAVADFTLAVDKGLNKAKKAEYEASGKPTADFIYCKAFGKTAESMAQYLGKGRKTIVQGSISTNSYTDKEGSRKTFANVLVSNFEFADTKNEKVSDTAYDELTKDYEKEFATVDDDVLSPF